MAARLVRIATIALAVLLFSASQRDGTVLASGRPGPGVAISHSVWGSLLRQHVRTGPDGINRVDYKRFKGAAHRRLKSYVESLQRASPSRMTRDAQMAFWLNLYNARLTDIVLDRYPVASVRDISLSEPSGKTGDGPWKAPVVTVEGRTFSLDDIANQMLHAAFADPRLHYALNCLSIGCPNLLPDAFLPERLERQLDAAAAAFVNHPRGITIGPGRVEASSLYQTFEKDFGGPKGVLAHMSRFARPALRSQLAGIDRIDIYTHDWRLNDVTQR
jgi:hypothetical protein